MLSIVKPVAIAIAYRHPEIGLYLKL